ncbi:MAG TPA: hypothetical protein VF278_18005, partial [Pirellulales bacterium]
AAFFLRRFFCLNRTISMGGRLFRTLNGLIKYGGSGSHYPITYRFLTTFMAFFPPYFIRP